MDLIYRLLRTLKIEMNQDSFVCSTSFFENTTTLHCSIDEDENENSLFEISYKDNVSQIIIFMVSFDENSHFVGAESSGETLNEQEFVSEHEERINGLLDSVVTNG
ncbi:MAG: hypothetical protein HAW67_00735 [Endozoicomonadaceae bacterium]|nr:hypothetical protein [Endozoicomonadaceae bacterium]